MSVKSSEITPEKVYKRRRTLVAAGVGVLALPLLDSAYSLLTQEQESTNQMFEPLAALPDSQDLPLTPTAYDTVTGYNNYYEFGFGNVDTKVDCGCIGTSGTTRNRNKQLCDRWNKTRRRLRHI